MPTNDHLWDEYEAARYLQCTIHAIRKWKKEGRIGYMKLGSAVRYDSAEIKAFAQRHRIAPRCKSCANPVHQTPPLLPEEVDPEEPLYATG